MAILGVEEPEADAPGVKPATAGFNLGNALLVAFSFLSLLMVSLFLICSRSMGDLPGTKAGAAVGAAGPDESIAALSTTLGVKLGELMLNFGIAMEAREVCGEKDVLGGFRVRAKWVWRITRSRRVRGEYE